jgi:hypothetical protein
MSFSAFAVFYCIFLWISFGPKCLLNIISARKERNPFYKAVYSYRYALIFVIFNIGIELVIILHQYL